MIEMVFFEKIIFNELLYKFEVGMLDIVGVVGLGVVVEYMEKIGYEIIQKYEYELLVYGMEVMSKILGICIIGIVEEKVSVIFFFLDGVYLYDVGIILDQMGIVVRIGYYCI